MFLLAFDLQEEASDELLIDTFVVGVGGIYNCLLYEGLKRSLHFSVLLIQFAEFVP